MIKELGPYTLVERGQVYSLRQLILTYKLTGDFSLNEIPHILVTGTTHDSSTRILCPLKPMRETSCDPTQDVTFIIDMNKTNVFQYKIFIYNFEYIEKLYKIKTVFGSSKNIPTGSRAANQDDTCDVDSFILINSNPLDDETNVLINTTPILSFNQNVDPSTLSAIELWEYLSGLRVDYSSAVDIDVL